MKLQVGFLSFLCDIISAFFVLLLHSAVKPKASSMRVQMLNRLETEIEVETDGS